MTNNKHVQYAFFLATVALVSVGYLFLIGYFLYSQFGDYLVNSSESNEAVTASASKWQTYSTLASATSFEYPENFSSPYIEPATWPPKIESIDQPFSCGSNRELRTIGSYRFCILREAVDDTVFYSYAFEYGEQSRVSDPGTVILSFSIRYEECGELEGEESFECANDLAAFNVDELVREIRESFQMKTPPRAVHEEFLSR